MQKKYGKYLPIGTVVLLKGARKELMITGYASIDTEKKDKIYDYSGCMYPEGVFDSYNSLLFDHDNIEKVSYLGYESDNQKEFNKKLLSILDEKNVQKILDEYGKDKKDE